LLLTLQVLKPGLDAGAARVFLEFLSYSSGPLPEEQFAKVQVTGRILMELSAPRKLHV
jgi:predicted anti-sigma-YlaC factor YlaD